MNRSIKSTLSVIVVGVVLLTSCNLPFSRQPELIPETGGTLQPEGLPAVVENTSAPEVAQVLPTETPQPEPTEEPVVHLLTPGEPTYHPDQLATDCNTGARMAAGTTQAIISGCDYWNREMLERPTANLDGTYIPGLDIIWSQAGKSLPWIFLKVRFNDLAQMPQGLRVGFELDPDLDSRGEFLLFADQPGSTAWTTNGVQVWSDGNTEVGGNRPFYYDQNNGDGYDTQLFNAGKGNDADLAWVRLSPTSEDTIEFAFKADMLTNQEVFGWWSWAGLTDLEPQKFELVDRAEDATTWNVDNSCSWIFGTKPTSGQLVNLCNVAQATPTVTPTNSPDMPPGCQVTQCRLGFYFDTKLCSCRPFIIIIFPTPTPFILY